MILLFLLRLWPLMQKANFEITLISNLWSSVELYRNVICRGTDSDWKDANFILLGAFNIMAMANLLKERDLVRSRVKYIEEIAISMKAVQNPASAISTVSASAISVGNCMNKLSNHSSVPDAFAPDASIPDTSTPDASIPDASAPDASAPDTSAPDASAPDTFAPDASTPDAFAPDASAPDTFAPDTFAPDAFAPGASA
ncbi:hypothetical protein BC937DRAFT_90726 [Endogone sp. FLAS-F59071]|nr:hypothetical protein BC937DRAFT_90726 [Endogone sp. FLAS-F59071]|eukprot:RUS16852.1 hypothetical protein BC937DRAFT_90726 [Endogone sp. FLAS-F59071]